MTKAAPEYARKIGDRLFLRNTKGILAKDPLRWIKAHQWIKKYKQKPETCEWCGRGNCRISYANLSQDYKHEVDDWACLCPLCHAGHDVKNHIFTRKLSSGKALWEFVKENPEEVKKIFKRKKNLLNKWYDTPSFNKLHLRNIEICLTWGEMKYTYAEIAKKHGLHKERVRQVLARYMRYLWNKLEPGRNPY